MLKIPHPSQLKPWLLGVCLVLSLTINQGLVSLVNAGTAAITGVEVTPVGNNTYSVSVTLAHADTGWDHYANRWDVLDEEGNLLGSRVLAHPHVDEQPFTRSLRVEIPTTVKAITIVAADSVHGDNIETVTVEIPTN